MSKCGDWLLKSSHLRWPETRMDRVAGRATDLKDSKDGAPAHATLLGSRFQVLTVQGETGKVIH